MLVGRGSPVAFASPPAVRDGKELIESLKKKNREVLVPNTRYSGARQRSPGMRATDYTRTGLGGDGVMKQSGLYLDADARFRSTDNRFYGGQRAVRGAAPRAGTAPDLALSVQSAAARQRRRAERAKLLRGHEQRVERAYANAVEDAELRDESSLYKRQEARLHYVGAVLDKDAKMERRKNPVTGLTHRGGHDSLAAHTMQRGRNRVHGLGDRTHNERNYCEKKFLGGNTSTKAMFGL